MAKIRGTRKIEAGEAWLDNIFVEQILPMYFPDNYSTETFNSELGECEYIVDHDVDAQGQIICSLTYRPPAQQFEVFNQAINSDYNKVAAPFEQAASQNGWDAEILGGDDGTYTFSINLH